YSLRFLVGWPGQAKLALAIPYRTTLYGACRLEVTDAGAPVVVADGTIRTGCLVPGGVRHGRRLQPGCPLQVGAGQVRAGQVGASQVRPLQVRVREVGPRQVCSEEDRAGQVGSAQAGPRERAVDKVAAREVQVAQVVRAVGQLGVAAQVSV